MRFLITGGSQGIGAAIVEHARNAGHDVVFTGRQQHAIDEVAKNSGAHGVKADVNNDADNARAVDVAIKTMGGVDVLINNAGVGYIADLGSIEMDRMRSLFATFSKQMAEIDRRYQNGEIVDELDQASGDDDGSADAEEKQT